MPNYDNSNSGAIFRNDRKRDDKDPDFTGSCEIGTPSVQWWIAAWVNEGKAGGKMENKRYFSLKFTPKDAPRAAVAPREDDMAPTPIAGTPKQETPPKPALPSPEDDTDSIPF